MFYNQGLRGRLKIWVADANEIVRKEYRIKLGISPDEACVLKFCEIAAIMAINKKIKGQSRAFMPDHNAELVPHPSSLNGTLLAQQP